MVRITSSFCPTLIEMVSAEMSKSNCVSFYLEFAHERPLCSIEAALGRLGPVVERLHKALLPLALAEEEAAKLHPSLFPERLSRTPYTPRLIAAPARCVSPSTANGVECAEANGGLRMRGVLLLRRSSRLPDEPERLVRKDSAFRRYLRRELCRIEVECVGRGREREVAARVFDGPGSDPALMDGLLFYP